MANGLNKSFTLLDVKPADVSDILNLIFPGVPEEMFIDILPLSVSRKELVIIFIKIYFNFCESSLIESGRALSKLVKKLYLVTVYLFSKYS